MYEAGGEPRSIARPVMIVSSVVSKMKTISKLISHLTIPKKVQRDLEGIHNDTFGNSHGNLEFLTWL